MSVYQGFYRERNFITFARTPTIKATTSTKRRPPNASRFTDRATRTACGANTQCCPHVGRSTGRAVRQPR